MPDMSQLYRATLGPMSQAWAYRAVAAGYSVFRRQDGRVTQAYHQHTLILTISGEGLVELGRACHAAKSGSLAWLDTSRLYAHGAAGAEPWVYLWAGVQGAGLDLLHKGLGFADQPVAATTPNTEAALRTALEVVAAALRDGGAAADGLVNRALAQVFETLAQMQADADGPARAGEDRLAHLCRLIRQDPAQDWDIPRMASAAGLSAAQLFRRFRQDRGTTPRDWLRRERIEMAGHLLAATPDKIATIALRCGYADPFHFSRDFKRVQGQSPRTFRLARRQGP